MRIENIAVGSLPSTPFGPAIPFLRPRPLGSGDVYPDPPAFRGNLPDSGTSGFIPAFGSPHTG